MQLGREVDLKIDLRKLINWLNIKALQFNFFFYVFVIKVKSIRKFV